MNKYFNILPYFLATVFILLLSQSVIAQDVSFTFANPTNTTSSGKTYYEVDVMISTTTDFKLGSGQLYFNYNTAAFGDNVFANSKITFTYPQADGYILGQVAGFPIYGPFVTNDNTTSRISFSWQQAVASGAFVNNVTTTATKLFHIKVEYSDATKNANWCFESSAVFDDQTYTACGPNSFALADCGGNPGTQIINDNFDCSAASLPVELISFTGQKQQQSALLEWHTATEINNKGFEVQKTTDNQQVEWQTIGFVGGAGTTEEEQFYDFVDDAPANGNNYYRLKQIDLSSEQGGLDEQFEYTNIVVVHFDNGSSDDVLPSLQMALYPNPTQHFLNVEIENATFDEPISIYNTLGIQVKTLRLDVSSAVATIDVQDLPAGTYFLRTKGQTLIFIKAGE